MKKPIVASYYQSDLHEKDYFIKDQEDLGFQNHDSGFCLYDYEKDEFVIYELSKALGMKHGLSRQIGCGYESSENNFNLFLKESGYDNDFSMFLNGQYYDKCHYMPLNRYVSGGFMGINRHLTHIVKSENHYFARPHHICHTYCGYIQSPFSRCLVLSYDAN